MLSAPLPLKPTRNCDWFPNFCRHFFQLQWFFCRYLLKVRFSNIGPVVNFPSQKLTENGEKYLKIIIIIRDICSLLFFGDYRNSLIKLCSLLASSGRDFGLENV